MIADLSDMLEDTSAIAVDVGQHMVWSYQSFKNHEDRNFSSPAVMALWAMDFRLQEEPIMQQENQLPVFVRWCTPDEYPGTGVGEERESSC